MNPLLLRRRGVIAARSKLWTPLDADVDGWWDASQLTGFANGDPVGLLPNIGVDAGTGDFLASGTERPTLVTGVAAMNGLPSLNFDGSNDFMSAGDVYNPGLNPFTVAIVAEVDSNTSAYRFFQKRGTGVFGSQDGWQVSISSSTWGNTGYDTGSNSIALGGSAAQTYNGTPHVIVWTCPNAPSSTTRLFVDGALISSNNHGATWPGAGGSISTTRPLTLACADNGGGVRSQFLDGLIGEAMFFFGDLYGTPDLDLLTAYLLEKWVP